ncbi:hypothetical protein OIPHN330_05500 [Citrobacter freundii]|uniref:Uncharacterized protein n=1 Tax=uncultured Citrobacter sp. TaxID=200446 RepID=A0A212I416_9ENTR|nr:hypothetical protein KM92CIT3_150044 [uncultured Citrobacter sp.]BDT21738.1 hypothetical protein CF204P1_04610 [Citrobacter freundii]GAL41902.1 hypothetical protein CIFRE_24_00950 [Citrobacter freundii ATCC 8090 = MTCC 1658 = NBRC 12681]BEJ31930.1 hypothetical protein OIPHN330_05500 [Citrobacter freundii]BEJ37837.1 hypothetical protein OIPHN354_05490 [Citrobacter freundii]
MTGVSERSQRRGGSKDEVFSEVDRTISVLYCIAAYLIWYNRYKGMQSDNTNHRQRSLWQEI